MKKVISFTMILLLLMTLLPIFAVAAEYQEFRFELSVDGSEIKTVSTGDIITVVLNLKRTDTSDSYTMYAMQDEIRYDSEFFRLVEGSVVLNDGIDGTDIGMRDNYRELYMNFLSIAGGSRWEANMLIGSFQLEVIATAGVSKITNQDYLVSAKDGIGSFPCDANELTVMVSTECNVCFESNGGSSVDSQTIQYGEKIKRPEDPTREGYIFSGWFKDIDKTEIWDFDSDIVLGNVTLFAKWEEYSDLPVIDQPIEKDGCCRFALILAGILLLFIIFLLFLRKKVTFTFINDSEVHVIHVFKNSKLKKPIDPKFRGKIFAGWYIDSACTSRWNFATDKVKKNITLYAKWDEVDV